ncbi:hypothetical protein ABZV58_22770 [Nocardia sp. NPDC004654]|uniref:hypothetical protein n=1 Tax=Nocardia sp. NPDC004654 TaxID=3154776 RepID=UPI0033A3124F
MDRLGVVDEIFLRTHRGLGTPIALQGLWRTSDRVEPALLQRIHDALRSGPLGRRVVRPRVPGARRGWRVNTRAHPLLFIDDPLPTSALLPWAGDLGAELDPEFGPGWRLAAAWLADGGSVVVLTCSHALADARGLVYAVDVALREVGATAGAAQARTESTRADRPEAEAVRHATSLPDTDRLADRAAAEPSSRRSGDAAARAAESSTARSAAARESDWADALRQWSIVAGGTIRALRQGIPKRPVSSTPVRTGGSELRVHSAVVQFRAADWDSVAKAHRGTANSLFIQLVVNLLWDIGFPDPTIGASLPVDTRDEPRVDNDLSMTEIIVDRSDTPATLRAKARAAYERRMTSPGGMPEELLQVIPDRWAYALSKGAGERDILCSNIGTLPDSLRTIGAHPCTGVAARAIHPHLTPARFPRTRLSGYLCRTGDDYVLSLVGLDPAIQSGTALCELTVEAATRLGLDGSPW